jgi:hypothetical protein
MQLEHPFAMALRSVFSMTFTQAASPVKAVTTFLGEPG